MRVPRITKKVYFPTSVSLQLNVNNVMESSVRLTGVDERWEDGLVPLLSRLHQDPQRPFGTEHRQQICGGREKPDE